nr:hypothetical protein GTC16762_33080 [Pigmentibacter ruber]
MQNNRNNLSNPKYLWFFVMSFTVIMIFANWFDPRLILIPFFNLETDAGTLIFPLTFLVSNIITEVYGYKHARKAIWCGFGFNLFGLLFGQLLIHFPSPIYADNVAFDSVIKKSSIIVIASMISYLVSEPLNSYIMSKMKIKFKNLTALRFVMSTFFAAFVDSIVFTAIAFSWYLKIEDCVKLALTMWMLKVLIESIGTLFSVRLTNYLKNKERIDIYDRKTKFNIFSLNTNYTTEDNEYKNNLSSINSENNTEYYITNDLTEKEIESSWNLVKNCFWSEEIPYVKFKSALNNSLNFCIVNVNSGHICGFGRVITDYYTYAYLCDVVIHPEYRKKGLGNILIDNILNHKDLQGLKTINLRTTKEAKKIYIKNGFKLAKDPEYILEKEDLNIYKKFKAV